MSKLETPLTKKYWRSVGGTLIDEFPAVAGSKDRARRLTDGVIIVGGKTRRAKASEVDLEGKDIIVIQTKAERLGIYLIGQALFSPKLMSKFKPKSIKSVAICTKSDAELLPLLKSYKNIEVVVL
jgi:hypothetical protein